MKRKLKIIVIGLGSAGDVHPNVGLALELRKRGHEVLFVAPAIFRQLTQSLGLEFVEVLSEDEYLSAIRDPDLWHPTRSLSVLARHLILPVMRAVFEIIEKTHEAGRTVVAAPGTAFGARIAQEKLGVPLATIHLQPIMLRSALRPACFGFPDIAAHLPPLLRRLYFRMADRWIVDPCFAGQTNAFRATLGLPPVRRLFDRWIHSPALVIGLFPDWFAPTATDWPPNVALTGFPLWDEREVHTPSPALEKFLTAGDPPLVFTAGSAMLHAKDFFCVSAEVCKASGRRGILLTRYPEQLPAELPEGVRHFGYVPFSELLPRSAALVHHGGIGTTAQAIAAGLPQLIVPNTHDQPDNAVRVRRLGLGEFLLPRAYTKVRVLEKLERLLRPAIKEDCRKRATIMAGTRSVEMASNLIEQL